MAIQLSRQEWVQAVCESGENVAFEFHVLEIRPGSVKVRPVIRAGELAIWQGKTDILVEDSAICLTGFHLDGGALVLKDFGDYI